MNTIGLSFDRARFRLDLVGDYRLEIFRRLGSSPDGLDSDGMPAGSFLQIRHLLKLEVAVEYENNKWILQFRLTSEYNTIQIYNINDI